MSDESDLAAEWIDEEPTAGTDDDTSPEMGTVDATTRTNVRDYLACDDHSDRTARVVCGECGQPLCDECSTSVPDVTLDYYERGGLSRLTYGLALAVGVPLLLNVLFPNLFARTIGTFFDSPLYLTVGIERTSFVVGLALLAALRYRSRFGLSTFDPLELDEMVRDLELLVRRQATRTVCDDCKRDRKVQKYLFSGITAVAGVLVVYGLYQSLPNLFFIPMQYTGLGIALYLVRGEIVAFVANRFI